MKQVTKDMSSKKAFLGIAFLIPTTLMAGPLVGWLISLGVGYFWKTTWSTGFFVLLGLVAGFFEVKKLLDQLKEIEKGNNKKIDE